MSSDAFVIEESLFSKDEKPAGSADQSTSRGEVKLSLEQLSEEQRTQADELLEKLSDQKLHLPLLPETAVQAMRLCSDPHVDFIRLDKLIRDDPTLTAKLLQVANSPFYQSPRPITSLRQAMMMLGLDTLRQVLTQSISESYLFKGKNTAEIKEERNHSLAVARIGEKLGSQFGLDSVELFMAGMLHDIGRLLAPQIFKKILKREVADTDSDFLAVMHAPIAGKLLASWGLPTEVAELVGSHHNLPANAPKRHHAFVLAEALAHQVKLGHSGDPSPESVLQPDSPTLQHLQVTEENLQSLLEQAQEVAEQLLGE